MISDGDTPYAWELNVWYHTLNVGYRARISGETDFPCIYGERVGLGRSYVRQAKLDYDDWVAGLREGRNYASDGKSHLIDFRVNGIEMGSGKDVELTAAGTVKVTAKVGAFLTSSRTKRSANFGTTRNRTGMSSGPALGTRAKFRSNWWSTVMQ